METQSNLPYHLKLPILHSFHKINILKLSNFMANAFLFYDLAFTSTVPLM